MTTPQIIVSTPSSGLFRVVALPGCVAGHLWPAIPVRLFRGEYVDLANAKLAFIRRAGCTVVTPAITQPVEASLTPLSTKFGPPQHDTLAYINRDQARLDARRAALVGGELVG